MGSQASVSSLAAPRPIGFHQWHDLLFLHWPVPAERIADLLPPDMVVDTWQGQAWVGLVAFRMSGIRPWWSPPVWRLSAFPETNVRTYVRREGDDEPAVWFLSLDADRLAAVLVGHLVWHLNYHWAHMRIDRSPGRIAYSSRRLDRGGAYCRIDANIDPSAISPSAPPGTFDEFLVERYVFYNELRDGRLQRGRVRHRPYALWPARVGLLEESLLAAAGVDTTGPPVHATFSPGVDVEIEPVQVLDEAQGRNEAKSKRRRLARV